ncbi:MAG: M1 family metallopeptidase [Flavobacteriales bacterium]|nr:M1 family metallopeptidase [Flavobacteriales bacterium]
MRNCCWLVLLLLSAGLSGQVPYFQQEVNYRINVTLDDEKHWLRGTEEFDYTNNSQQSLDTLYIHLWPNAYKNEHSALARALARSGDYTLFNVADSSKGYIDSLEFRVDGQPVKWMYHEHHRDVAWIKLSTPLLPGRQLTVSTPFRVKIPSGQISRFGHVGQSYQVTQWYPKPAVYDRNGWHPIPYLDQGEFYSEFGSYNVNISLPANYTVGATGDLQTEAEIKRLDELAKEVSLDEFNSFPPSSSAFKTLRYVQHNVHDFAWFADKRFIVEKSEVTLPRSGRKVTTWAMFTPGNGTLWKGNAVTAINHAILTYSDWVGDYPYNHCTAIDGTISAGGGMEYPNVTVIGNSGSVLSLNLVIIHEVGHNWFYGILGSNERDHAWMDEGINSYYETRSLRKLHPELNVGSILTPGLESLLGTDDMDYRYTDELAYLFSARRFNDQPIELTSSAFSSTNYGTIVYKKTALAFGYLYEYLGQETFDRCMHTYFDRWKFKHPSPNDLRDVFEEVSGKNLEWFFGPLIQSTDHIDYAVTGLSVDNKRGEPLYYTKIVNRGDIASPYSITTLSGTDTLSVLWMDPIDPLSSAKIALEGFKKGDRVIINSSYGIPEFDRSDNLIRSAGWPRKSWPVKWGLFSAIDHPEKRQLFYAPLLGWNEYNRLMPGIWLHNQTIPSPDFTWNIAPMFSLSTGTLNGFASLRWERRTLTTGIQLQRFAEDRYPRYQFEGNNLRKLDSYSFIRPYISFNLLPHRSANNIAAKAGFQFIYVDHITTDLDSRERVRNTEESRVRISVNARWKMHRSTFKLSSMFEYWITGDKPNSSHRIEHSYIWFPRTKSKLISRLFISAGNILSIGGTNGPLDYNYDGLFFGRSETEGILSQQVINTQGGLMYPTQMTPNGTFATFSLEFDAPIKFPIALYGGIAVMNETFPTHFYSWDGWEVIYNTRAEGISWVGGVTLPIARDVFQIYVPLVISDNFINEHKIEPLKFGETILFEMHLDLFNPLNILRNIEL